MRRIKKKDLVRFTLLLLAMLALPVAAQFPKGYATTSIAQSQTYHSELEYLKAVNSAGPADDPQIIFLLMAQYLNSNQHEAGIEFFKSFLDKKEFQVPPPTEGALFGRPGAPSGIPCQ